MSMRFLHIKRANMTDLVLAHEVQRDIISNTVLLEKIYEGCTHDTCAITEDGEWLLQGRSVDPSTLLKLYPTVFVYIHSPSRAYDTAILQCKAHTQKFVAIYNATDSVIHHTERLASLIKTHGMLVKIPHEKYVDTQTHNESFTPSSDIASSYIRNIFLPVHVVPSLYREYTPHIHVPRLAHNHTDLAKHIDDLRHVHSQITLREHIQGEHIYVASIPNLRKESIYITMPVVSKDVGGLIHFQEAICGHAQKKEITQVVSDISQVLFKDKTIVYKLKVHGKRGVFVEHTFPGYCFILHNHDFLFTLASSHGIQVQELFETFWR